MHAELKLILDKIESGAFYVLQNKTQFRFFIVQNGSIIEKTDMLNIIHKMKIKENSEAKLLDRNALYSQIDRADFIQIVGSGYDKAGSFLATIAHKIAQFKGFQTALTGDAYYTSL